MNYLSTGMSFVNSMDHSRPITSYNSLESDRVLGIAVDLHPLWGGAAVFFCAAGVLCRVSQDVFFFLFSLMEYTPEIPGGHLHPRLSDRGLGWR